MASSITPTRFSARMPSMTKQRHGIPDGAYAERPLARHGRLEPICANLVAPLLHGARLRKLQANRFVQRVAAHEQVLQDLSSESLATLAQELSQKLWRAGFAFDVAAETFALIRAVAARTLGMRHYDAQIQGGWVLLNGMIAEMDTGEGKTLTATLPACTAALARLPVHIITVNDYLAQRDADAMRPLYQAFGLTVGVVIPGMAPLARQQAYACDITYCTNKELVFDYLKDRIVLGPRASRAHLQLERLSAQTPRLSRLLLRGLHFAIVDEADSVLIDEARTPLIISREAGQEINANGYHALLAIAEHLTDGEDFVIDNQAGGVTLTDTGCHQLTRLSRTHSDLPSNPWQRDELIRQALTALHLMKRDTDYLVQDNKIQIIDEYTGRVMADRAWEQGLHQFIEAKEGCDLTKQFEPLSRITYQRFFRRYLHLSGMTGTAREVRRELWSVYRLGVVTVAPQKPSRRKFIGERVYETAPAKWRAVVGRIAEVHQRHQPILVGARTVGASEHLSSLLTVIGLPHQVLNAKQNREEAEVIAQAGMPGKITVATNMAGRGTDIRLPPETIALGGLYVLGTERHEAARIDRQLFGRCGRQGDPGSYEMIVSLEDELFTVHGGDLGRWLPRRPSAFEPIGIWIGQLAGAWAQHAAERLHRRVRRDLLRAEDQLATALAFTGRIE